MDIAHILTLGLLLILYCWTAYNIPIFAIGVRHMLRSDSKEKEESKKKSISLPTISIVVPVKDEERVIERLLKALIRLDYPSQKKEIIIVEDASTDRTSEICRNYAERYPEAIKFFHREISRGKPSALNYGFKKAKGEIVTVFDADNVPESDTLIKATKYFEDPSVAAVQGLTCTINAEENMITKIVSYEEAVWLKNYLHGKDALKLFVPLTGSCQFIRRDIAEQVGFWDENCLAEDLEMSARITEKGYSTRFAPDLISWQEAPSKLTHLMKQRVRWYRGYMEVAIKYGRFLKNLEKKTFDAEVTLMGPYVLSAFFLSYIMSLYFTVFPIFDPIIIVMTEVTLLLTMFTLLIAGIALIYASKPMRVKNILWLPFIYVYWSLQCVLTTYALLLVIFRRPRRWTKTEKTGRSTKNHISTSELV